MWTVYKKTDPRPVPPGAAIEQRKVMGEAQAHAVFTDGRGRRQAYPLAEDDPGTMLVERRCWYFDYTGPDGRRRTEKGYTDKKATEELAEKRQLEAARQRDGLPVADRQKNRTA